MFGGALFLYVHMVPFSVHIGGGVWGVITVHLFREETGLVFADNVSVPGLVILLLFLTKEYTFSPSYKLFFAIFKTKPYLLIVLIPVYHYVLFFKRFYTVISF